MRIYSGGSHLTFVYGKPTTLFNRISLLGDNSAYNKMILTGFRSTNLIFNNGYWFEV
jgi:hypothetical protein